MCHLFAGQSPDSYAFETRSIRLNGQSTSIRLERVFWDILEDIAAAERMTVPRFISTLHQEILLLRGEVPNQVIVKKGITVGRSPTNVELGGFSAHGRGLDVLGHGITDSIARRR